MRTQRTTLLLAAGVAVVTLAVFLPCLANGFVRYDDPGYVTENEVVRGGLSLAAVRWAFTTLAMTNWHPLTWLSHLADVTVFGLSPTGHHATSVIVHALNAGLAVIVLARIANDARVGAAAAALFALHPLRVESVAWVSERKDVLCAFFFLLTLWAYVAWARAPERRLPYAASLAAFALGLLAKPMLVTVPPLLLLLDVTVLGRWHRRLAARRLLEKLPFAALAAASAVATVVAQEQTLVDIERFPLWARAANAVVSIGRYLSNTVWPAELSVIYPPHPDGYPALVVVGAGALVAALTAGALGLRRDTVLAGWLWFLGMLVPVLGFVAVGSNAMADRYTYLPHLGLFLALASVAAMRRIGLLALACAALALVPRTLAQITVWQDTQTLFQNAVDVEPDAAYAHFRLADALFEVGDRRRGLEHAARAAVLLPDDPEIVERLGFALYAVGDAAESERALLAVVAVYPNRSKAWALLARIAREQGRADEANARAERAVKNGGGESETQR